MSDKKVVISIQSQTDGVRAGSKAVLDLRQQVINLQKDLKELSSSGSLSNKVITEQKAHVDALTKSLDKAVIATSRSNKVTRESLAIKRQDIALTNELANANEAVIYSRQRLGMHTMGAAKNLRQLSANLSEVHRALKTTERSGYATASSIEAITKGKNFTFDKAISSMDRAKIMMGNLSTGIKSVGMHLSDAGKQAQWFGRQLTVGLSLPIATLGTLATRTGKDVEQEMVRLKKVFNDAAGDIDKEVGPGGRLDNAFNSLRDNLGIQKSLAVAVAADWAQMGYDATELGDILEEVFNFAALGDMDIGDATDFFRSIMAVWRTEGENFNEALKRTKDSVAQLNAIENSTALGMRELQEGFATVAPYARSMGIEVDELGAMLAGMYERGIPANEAATALRMALSRLTAPTGNFRDKLEELGIQVFDNNDKIRSGNELLKELANAYSRLKSGGVGTQQSFAFLKDWIERRQGSRLLALLEAMSEGDSDYAEALAATADQARATARAESELQKIRDSIATKLDKLRAVWKDLLYNIFQALEPIIRRVIENFTNLVDKFKQMDDGAKRLAAGFLVFGAVIGPFIMFQSVLANSFGALLRGMGSLIAIIPGLAATANGLSQEFLEQLVSAGLLDGKIAHLGDKYIYTGSKSALARAEAQLMTKAIQEQTIATLQLTAAQNLAIANDATKKLPYGPTLPNPSKDFGYGEVPEIPKGVDVDIDTPTKKVKKNGNLILRLFKNIGHGVKGLFNKLMSAPKGVTSAIGKVIKFMKSWKNILGLLRGAISKTFTGAVIVGFIMATIAVIKNLKANWTAFVERSKAGIDKFKSGLGILKDSVMGIWNVLKNFFNTFGGGKGGKGGPWTFIADAINSVGDAFHILAVGMGFVINNMIKPIIIQFLNIVQQIVVVFGAVVRIVSGVIDIFHGNVRDGFKKIGGALKDAFIAMLKSTYAFVRPMIQAFTILTDAIGEAIGFILQGVSDLVAGMAAGIGALERHIPGLSKLTGGIGDKLENFSDDVEGLSNKFQNWSADGMMRELDKLANYDHFDDVADKVIDPLKVSEPEVADYAEGFGTEIGEHIGEGIEDGVEDSTKNAFRDVFDRFRSAFKSNLDDIIDEIKDKALNAFKKSADDQLAVYDKQIKAIDDLIKKEEEQFKKEEYLRRRRDLIRKFELDEINYQRDRALALYEGRIDDTRKLDLDFQARQESHYGDLSGLDEDRRKEVLASQRELEKEKLKMQQDALDEQLKAQEDALKKQLDLITKYTPYNKELWANMLGEITNLVGEYGVTLGTQGYDANLKFAEAIKLAKTDVLNAAQWAGELAGLKWLEAFMGSDFNELISNLNSNEPTIGGNGGSLGGGGGGGGGSTPSRPPSPTGWYGADPEGLGGMGPRGGSPVGSGSTGTMQFAWDPFVTRKTSLGYQAPGWLTRGFEGPKRTRHAGGRVGGDKEGLAMLQRGEYVLQKSAVDKIGPNTLDNLNTYHSGGLVNVFAQMGKNMIGHISNAFLSGIGSVGGLTSKGAGQRFSQGRMPVRGIYSSPFMHGLDPRLARPSYEHYAGLGQDDRVQEMSDEGAAKKLGGNWPIIPLANYLLQSIPGLVSMGTYNNRFVAGTHKKSLHAYGRAVDLGGSRSAMDDVFALMTANFDTLGLQELIYKNMQMFNTGNGVNFRKKSDHFNHVHIGIQKGAMAKFAGGASIMKDNVPALLHRGEQVVSAPMNKRLIEGIDRLANGEGHLEYNVTIEVENFIGEREWFYKMMKEHDIKVEPHTKRISGTEGRRIDSINRGGRR